MQNLFQQTWKYIAHFCHFSFDMVQVIEIFLMEGWALIQYKDILPV